MIKTNAIVASLVLVIGITACDRNEGGQKPSGAAAADTVGSAAPALPQQTGPTDMDSVPVRSPEGGLVRFGVKAGEIEYSYSGSMHGIRRVYFDDWGMLERRYDSASQDPSIPGPPQHKLLISTPDELTMVDFIQNNAWSMPNLADDQYRKSDSSKQFSLAEMVFRNSGGTRLPDDSVAGFRTRVLKMQQQAFTSTVWVWRGIILKEHFQSSDGRMDFMVSATNVKLNIDVPDTMFRAPKGIKIDRRPAPGQMPQGGAMPPGHPMPGAPGQGMPPQGMPPGGAPQGMPPGGSPQGMPQQPMPPMRRP